MLTLVPFLHERQFFQLFYILYPVEVDEKILHQKVPTEILHQKLVLPVFLASYTDTVKRKAGIADNLLFRAHISVSLMTTHNALWNIW